MKKTFVALAVVLGTWGGWAAPLLERSWRLDGSLAEAHGECPFAPRGRVLATNDDPLYDLTPGFRLACRVKFDRLDADTGWPTLVRKGHDNDRGAFFLRVDQPPEARRLSFFINLGDGPEPRVSSPVALRTNEWYDVAAGWDGTNVWLTVNGIAAKRPRTGAAGGCAAPLTVGPLGGRVRNLSVANVPAAVVPTADEEPIGALFRLACKATFDALPTGETTLVVKEHEYLLRYDVEKGGEPGRGYFAFWVYLNGGWEPRVIVKRPIELGQVYRLAAAWDGRRSYLSVDGDGDEQVKSGQTSPIGARRQIGRIPGRVADVRVKMQKESQPRVDNFRTLELMPRAGRPFTLLADLVNAGAVAASNCQVRVEAGDGQRITPACVEGGSLAPNAAQPLRFTVDPGTGDVVVVRFSVRSDGRTVARTTKRVAVMPLHEPDFAAPAWTPPHRTTRTFHVDARTGDDRADGLTPQTAWRTFAPLKGRTLGPGEELLLRRGCVFTEELVVGAQGASGNWAEIGAYGEGARPILRRTRFIQDRCALIACGGCLAVRDLVVCNAGKGLGIECTRGNLGGLLVERCLAHHIEGLYRFNAHGIPEWRDRGGAAGGPGGGIGIGGEVKRAVLRDCEMYQCSSGFHISGQDVVVRRVFCHDNACPNTSPHPFMTGTLRAWLLDSVFDASGWNASAGTMGIMLGYNDGLEIRNSHFLNQPDSGSSDEGGIDFEAGGDNCLIDGCTFRNNAGAAIEVLGLMSPQARNTHIRRSRFDRNNWKNILGPSEIFVWGGTRDPGIVCSSGRIEDNGFVLAPGVMFYTNQAERTRADWSLARNTEYTTWEALDRAMPYPNPPQVVAGPELWVTEPCVRLQGCVTDDGRARATTPGLAVAWECLEGPGGVRFGTEKGAQTLATFGAAGDYRLLLRADNGEFWRTARTAVHVLPRGARVVKAWTFAKNHDGEGWCAEGLGTVKEYFKGEKPIWNTFANPVDIVAGDYWVMAVKEAKRAHIATTNRLGLVSNGGRQLVLRLQNHTNSRQMKLTCVPRDNPAGAFSRAFDVVPHDEEDRVYTVPISLEGTIDRLRLDFSADGETPVTGTVRIDYMWFGDAGQ